MNNREFSKRLLGLRSTLPALVLQEHFFLRPDMEGSYTEHQKEHFMNDIRWILSFLSESIWARQPVLFEEFTSWLKTFLTSVNVPMKDVAESFEILKRMIIDTSDQEEAVLIRELFSSAVSILMSEQHTLSLPARDNSLGDSAGQYLQSLLKGNRREALEGILGLSKGGMPIRDIYLDVFQPVQYEIGRLWQTNRISVAQEHYCTAATQFIMSQLYPYMFTGQKKSRKLVTACVQGELHEMGPRMLTDLFEMEGWDTYYLGANMPVDGVVRFVSEHKPQVLAISATMTFHVSSVYDLITKIRASSDTPREMKVLVGGYPFRVADGLWKEIGADGYAGSAQEAITLADSILAE